MSSTQADELIALIRNDMRQAMKDRESVRLGALRSIACPISNAEAVAPEADRTREGPIAAQHKASAVRSDAGSSSRGTTSIP